MVEPSQVQAYIEEGLDCEFIKVVGDGRHFEAIIVSKEFEGKLRIKQHQLVYGALGSRMDEEIHALSMKTFTPEKWEKNKHQFGL